VINACLDGHEPGCARVAGEVHGFPRDGKAILYFRTDRDIFKILTQCVGNVAVVLVPSVVAYSFAQDAPAYPYSYLFHSISIFIYFYQITPVLKTILKRGISMIVRPEAP
jgi:hypothetical protein